MSGLDDNEAPYNTVILPCPSAERLEPIWRELQERSNGSFFLSWPWIGTLVALHHPSLRLVQVRAGEQLVGLALLGGAGRARFPDFLARNRHLNETGDASVDSIMIEYNGLLAATGAETGAADAVLETLFDPAAPEIGGLSLAGISADWIARLERHGLSPNPSRGAVNAPYADLRQLPFPDLLDGLSRNSRQQIRRSMRYYKERGEPSLSRARDKAEALDWLNALEELHTASWRARGKAGAFGNPSFRRFHRALIDRYFEEGVLDLLCARAGEQVFGYLYNFCWRGIVYAYQSGFRFEADRKCRPGLVAHSLAMALYRQERMEIYRFLAGASRYKNSLSSGNDALYWVVARRPNLLTRYGETIGGLWLALRRRSGI